MMLSAEELISLLQLEPHFEGGYSSVSYTAPETIPHAVLPARFGGERPYCNAIYYLLKSGQKCILHKIAADELWHFLMGGTLEVYQISPSGAVDVVRLGTNVRAGEKLVHSSPAGHWVGAIPADGTEYSLIGCSCSPGFDFADWHKGEKKGLITQFPKAKEAIEKLCDE